MFFSSYFCKIYLKSASLKEERNAKKNNDFLKKGVVGICIFSTVTIYGTDYYVATSGSGTTCNASTPCDLSTALNNASDGDRIALAAGTYTGSGDNVVELTKGISLYGGWDGISTISKHIP